MGVILGAIVRALSRPVMVTLSAITILSLVYLPLSPLARTPLVYAANDIVVTETGGNSRVFESTSSTDTFSVRLSNAPTANVIISVTSSDTTETTVSPSQLTFTPANWNVDQVVTVAGVDDGIADGNQTSTIALQASGAPEYAGKSASVTVTTIDASPQNTAGFNINESGGETRVNESGTTDTFTVVLTKQPTTGQVVLNVTSSDTTEVNVTGGNQLTFTTSNWNTAQTVTVTGVDDTIPDGNQVSPVIVSVNQAATTAPEYQSLANQTVSVTTVDNETPAAGMFLSKTTATTTESGGTDSITVRLTQAPTSNVVVNITSSNTGEATVSPTTLTFTPTDWNSKQTVTLTGVDDSVADGPQTVSVVLSVNDTLSAPEYRPVPDQTLTVTNQDNEPIGPGITLSKTSASVNESGTTDTFTVVLTKAPGSNVVLSVTSSRTGEATVSPGQLTFTPSKWDQPETVTITGVDDNAVDGNQTSTITISVVDSLSDDQYDPVADRTVTVTTVDNDPQARIAPVPLTAACGTKLSNLGPLLTWTQEPGAKWFQLQVIPFNNDGPGVNLIISDTAQVVAAQYQVKEPDFGGSEANYVMLPDLTYTWHVRTAVVGTQPVESDWSPWSADCTFETANKTSATISLQTPVNGAGAGSRTPILQWSNSDKTVFYYEVQVDKDANFSQAAGAPMLYWELRHGGVSNPPNSYAIPGAFPLESNTTYFWRVRVRIQGDGTPVAWTPAASFRTP